MRLPRFRLRVRTLLVLVALVALALVGLRTYRDGPETHWLLMKLRHGNVEARRSAAFRVGEAGFLDIVDDLFSPPVSPGAAAARWHRQQRRAELLLPALVRVAEDPDAECRALAVRALHDLAVSRRSKPWKRLALRQVLAATRDRKESVRVVALGSLAGLAAQDTEAVIQTLRSALVDPSVEVRQAATKELGVVGVCVPAAQADVTSILIPLLASREDPRVRAKAAWGLCLFGADHRRHPAGAGPNVVLALVAAFRDPEVDVRRTVATILGLTTYWDQRKDAILPALNAAISDDDDETVREDSALALFALGQRDLAIIELIEQAARDPDRSWKKPFDSALEEWRREREAEASAEPAASGDDAP